MESLIEAIKNVKEDEINDIINQFKTKGFSNEKHLNLLLDKILSKYSQKKSKEEPIKDDFDLC
jgi:hypothetical protein